MRADIAAFDGGWHQVFVSGRGGVGVSDKQYFSY
jgi:hypothetical protein